MFIASYVTKSNSICEWECPMQSTPTMESIDESIENNVLTRDCQQYEIIRWTGLQIFEIAKINGAVGSKSYHSHNTTRWRHSVSVSTRKSDINGEVLFHTWKKRKVMALILILLILLNLIIILNIYCCVAFFIIQTIKLFLRLQMHVFLEWEIDFYINFRTHLDRYFLQWGTTMSWIFAHVMTWLDWECP